MQSPSPKKRRVDEISFTLQNIFILHPTAASKYKIRVIVNRNNREHQFKKVKNRYIFQMAHDQREDITTNACFLSLLEKNQKAGPDGQYLEIGKGEIELSDLLDPKSRSTVNGVIYGTRSYNYDRIIGKYSYQISRTKADAPSGGNQNHREGSNEKKSRLIDFSHKKGEKPPEFAFKQSIISHSNEINNKIK